MIDIAPPVKITAKTSGTGCSAGAEGYSGPSKSCETTWQNIPSHYEISSVSLPMNYFGEKCIPLAISVLGTNKLSTRMNSQFCPNVRPSVPAA